ncbi:acyl-CoA thioesterase II [Bradyrhizobium sp. CNPSo 4010]|uniref:Acyl-CoA thioesterase II n=1 Tax=Bradyrhizobium agreste TaxID=2751811 RepID=A0ABS0PH82_9BRAD|nr:acyl-CoA thioesterase II [Bradyrhizobium agreste]MBH5396302.1 acyl-CoA thioesterase II [Bradyrhizobium agreste]
MQKDLIGLAAILNLDSIGGDVFLGKSPNLGEQRVFGGLIIGQALFAACRTIESGLPNSLHCYFIHTGDPQVPLIYSVERLRDGRSYSTRRVTATQQGSTIFSSMVSFHKGEQGVFEHQDKMPPVPAPEHFAAEQLSKIALQTDLPDIVRRYYEPDRAVELRPVEIGRYVGQRIEDGRLHMWMKAAKKLPDDPALHICALAYASDLSLLDAVMARYGRTLFDGRIYSGSLDHAMWFHRPFRADDWLLYAKDSPSAQSGRGLARGLIFRRDGTLVASIAQEGSVRERR